MDVDGRMAHRGGRPGHRSACAFTLIEVLVVVAIIATLVAILLPALAKSREQAKRTLCASNQKQIAAGIYMYASAFGGRIPCSIPEFNAGLTWMVWQSFGRNPYPPNGWVHHGLLYAGHQIRDPKVFFCPSYTEFPHVYPAGWRGYVSPNGAERVATSYAYALNGQVDLYPTGVRVNARLDEFKSYEALHCCVFLAKVDKRQEKGVWPHRGGVNAGYADGSVQLPLLKDDLAVIAAKLYDENSMPKMDYFAFCFFKMLSGDRHWINAYPKVLTQ
jgi:prepilin-type N-terminal cleavage/methylation domain-containing protein/prepilin-type processing-associated H-X9-DG protein